VHIRLLCFVVPALFLTSALAAQVLPIPQDHFSADQRQFRSAALTASQAALNDFRAAWQANDARATARLMAEDGLLVLPWRESRQGRRPIQEELSSYLPRAGNLLFSLVDGDVGGDMVYLFGQFHMEARPDGSSNGSSIGSSNGYTGGSSGSAASVEPAAGSYTAVLQRSGRSWRIRALVFTPDVLRPHEDAGSDAD
jgi:ketosteroid isomerase-like protein